MKAVTKKPKTVDYTKGKKPNEHQVYCLTAQFMNGNKYHYNGKTKKEALQNFKHKWNDFTGFNRIEWSFEEA